MNFGDLNARGKFNNESGLDLSLLQAGEQWLIDGFSLARG